MNLTPLPRQKKKKRHALAIAVMHSITLSQITFSSSPKIQSLRRCCLCAIILPFQFARLLVFPPCCLIFAIAVRVVRVAIAGRAFACASSGHPDLRSLDCDQFCIVPRYVAAATAQDCDPIHWTEAFRSTLLASSLSLCLLGLEASTAAVISHRARFGSAPPDVPRSCFDRGRQPRRSLVTAVPDGLGVRSIDGCSRGSLVP
ncbi:hypothetical protein B0H13DRAFT_443409 [Mycena leptocephala]|nr:hypothetical protein B0H13DRAFT_443409 [Mycena leptocephala]